MMSVHLRKQRFIPSRMAGEAALKVFAPKMGKRYANGRNFDRGMGKHRDVSMLSPYLRRRLVLEQDVVATAVQMHGAEEAEKFIQEVVWRAYFKGWLEHRPVIWDLYKEGLAGDLAALDRDRGLRKRIEAAETGQTGLDYFDSWAKELVETGYLHNHARMWFASIWIFSLELPSAIEISAFDAPPRYFWFSRGACSSMKNGPTLRYSVQYLRAFSISLTT